MMCFVVLLEVLQQQFGSERAVLNDKCSIWRAVVPSQKATDGIVFTICLNMLLIFLPLFKTFPSRSNTTRRGCLISFMLL